jgi:hypothetical protein
MPEPTPNNPDSSKDDPTKPPEKLGSDERVIQQLMKHKGFSRQQATEEVAHYS